MDIGADSGMDKTTLDVKAQARLGVLTRWAAEAALAGLQVPGEKDLELIAVAKSAEAAALEARIVQGWAATMNWLMSQANFGVTDPYLQLPSELQRPVGMEVLDAAGVPETSVAVGVPEVADAAGVPETSEGTADRRRTVDPKNPETVPVSKMPKWEAMAREQVRRAIARYTKPLHELKSRDANEGDTRLVVTDILCEGLNYDKFKDLTTEYMVKQDFADYGVRIDKQLVAFIEVKRISQKLNERHLRQVQMYAVNEGIEWMVLTNGAVWQAYHLTGGLPVIVNMAFEVDLLGPASLEDKADLLFLLHREALKRRRIDEAWKHRAATEPQALLEVILSETILDQIRKEVKRRTGTATTPEAVSEVIRGEIVDPKLLARLFKS